MQFQNVPGISVENTSVPSQFLQRNVKIDFFVPKRLTEPYPMNLLLINDGQNLEDLGLADILEQLYAQNMIEPLICAGIHAGEERKMEYGIAGHPDYLGRGAKAGLYSSFILEELLPLIYRIYPASSFKEMAFAGFSLGGLMALDIVWNHPDKFSRAGMFSGSLWWRNIDQHDNDYDDNKHRIMQQLVRYGKFASNLKFFFQCGNMDETKDRNGNGIIDSVDDTLDLIEELKRKGYKMNKNIYYLELADGRHDIATWARAMPEFLKWSWGKNS
ncbi:MAG TPA: alpha/beta hydrolase-fold protein [Chitinophagaceae bacterium]|nr:alpha/beta hydrolase-fold protein [Chitinophagaceae bacterium]